MSAPAPGPACSRCHGTPAPNSASSICPECAPGTPLCQGCYVTHAREVIAGIEDEPATDFYHSNLRREQLQMAKDVVAIADRQAKPLDLPGDGITIPVIEGDTDLDRTLAGLRAEVDAAIAALRATPVGMRDQTLFQHAVTLAASGVTTEEGAWAALSPAVHLWEMDENAARITFRTGWLKGASGG